MIARVENESGAAPAARPKNEAQRTFVTCFSTLGCPELSLPGVILLAREFDIRRLEIRALENRVDLPAYLSAQPGGLQAARESLDEAGIRARVLGTSFKLVGHEPRMWEELSAFAGLADSLEAPYLRVFGGGTWGKPLMGEDFAQAAGALERWEAERSARGWKARLLVETHDAFSASEPCLRLQERAAAPVEFIWDSHHTWRLGGESPDETWNALGPGIRHVHVKDSIDVPSARHPYTYVLPGEGEMPAGAVRQILIREKFEGAVSLEWEKMWHPYLPPLGVALEAWRKDGWI